MEDTSNKWRDDLFKQIEVNFPKVLDEIRKLISTDELSKIISFVHLLLLDQDKTIEQKEHSIKCITHSLISSICWTLMPLTNVENIDNFYQKFRETMYHDILYSITYNIAAVKKAMNEEIISEFDSPSTTVH